METVEVFSTNVKNHDEASFLVEKLKKAFPEFRMNFDLEDCDKILRIESGSNILCAAKVIDILAESGFNAEVLPDLIATKYRAMDLSTN